MSIRAIVESMTDYHQARLRRLWTCIDALSDEQYTQPVAYSMGAIRDHMVHLLSAERRYFSRITGQPIPERLVPADYPDRASLKARYDEWLPQAAAILARLSDDDLARTVSYELKRFNPDRTIQANDTVWQILLHVVNHATDHTAQLLRILHDFGAPTFEQDYILYLWDKAEEKVENQ